MAKKREVVGEYTINQINQHERQTKRKTERND
jgi:hypothetical protein